MDKQSILNLKGARSAPREQSINEEAGLSNNWVPADVAPIIPGIPQGLPDGAAKYLTGTMPPAYQHDSSFVGTAYKSSNAPALSIMPLGIQGNPLSNAAIQSTSNLTVVGSSAADIDVVVTDGLLPHGDPVWALDPSYVILRDDFIPGTDYSGAGTNEVGQLLWQLSNNINTSMRMGLGPNHMGEFHIGNNTTVSATVAMSLLNGAAGTTVAWALLDYPGWQMTFVFRFHRPVDTTPPGVQAPPSFLKKALYLGMFNSATEWLSGMNRPPQFIGLRYDTSATAPAISDSTMKFECVGNPMTTVYARSNVQGQVVDTGIVPSEDVYYRLDIRSVAAGVVSMSLNGSSPATFVIPPQTIVNDVTSQGIASGFGQAVVKMGISSVSGIPPFGQGSKVLIGGLLGGNILLNGNQVLNQANAGNQTTNDCLNFPSTVVQGNNGPTGFFATGLPAFYPLILFGNDDTAGPANNDCMFAIDYFSYVYSPSIAGIALDKTLARYSAP